MAAAQCERRGRVARDRLILAHIVYSGNPHQNFTARKHRRLRTYGHAKTSERRAVNDDPPPLLRFDFETAYAARSSDEPTVSVPSVY
jgi:hypothetical protein